MALRLLKILKIIVFLLFAIALPVLLTSAGIWWILTGRNDIIKYLDLVFDWMLN